VEAIGDLTPKEFVMEFWKYRRRPTEVVVTDTVAGPPDHRDAFAEGLRQGARQERARHRHPILTLVVVLVALAGAAMLAVAAREGSFSRGGQVVDQTVAVAADKAKVASADAAAQTGQAIKAAGSEIQHKAADVTAPKP
jgi:hypothetical protein